MTPGLRPLAGAGKRRGAFAAAGLLALTLAAYLPVLDAGFLWDDDAHVEDNRTLRSPGGLRRIWFDLDATPQYYPLVHTSYWLEYRLWGLEPAGYHAVNLLLHAAAAILAWRVLLLLGLGPAAWAAAALFAVHPVQVESVAWITERKNVLSGALYLGSMLALLRCARVGDEPAPRGEPGDRRAVFTRPGMVALALGTFVLALLSKTVTCSLPAAALLLIYYTRGPTGWRRSVRLVAPLFAVGAALAGVTVWLEKYRVGAAGESWDLSPVERGLVAGRALWFYAGKLFWPVGLSFNYPRWAIDAGELRAWGYPLAAAVALLLCWLARGRIGRGPVVALLFFAGTLLPALGFFDVYPMRYSFVADHFQYLASLGPIALASGAAYALAARWPAAVRRGGAVLLCGLLVLLGSLTWQRARVFHDRETLWRDTLRKNPDSWLAHSNLAGLLQQDGRPEPALQHFREALRIQQGLPERPDEAQALVNVAGALSDLGRLDEARSYLLQALDVRPGYHRAHHNLAVLLRRRGHLDEALEQFRLAIASKPGYVNGYFNLANTLAASGRLEEAIAAFERAKALDPDRADIRENLETARELLRRRRESGTPPPSTAAPRSGPAGR